VETLPNGIVLPDPWPPRALEYPSAPMCLSYLQAPPAVIPIDVGRQLFVDDFLVGQTTLQRTFHRPEPFADNPVLKPDQPWELMSFSHGGATPHAMPFSDGVWFDPADRLFKMWYYGGMGPSPSGGYGVTAYAVSPDGIRWEKPQLGATSWLDLEQTNIVRLGARDSTTVWLDHQAPDAGERYKMTAYSRGFTQLFRSADGISWSKAGDGARTGDRTTFFYNPFRRKWVFSIRAPGALSGGRGRVRIYWESGDFFAFSDRIWGAPEAAGLPPGDFFQRLRAQVERQGVWPSRTEAVLWTGADSADPRWMEFPQVAPQLYNLDAVAYESILLGLFSVWRGDFRADAQTTAAQALDAAGRPKSNEVFAGFSRDGFHWDRPDRRPFIPSSPQPGAWNWGNVQSAGGGCLVVGDRLFFYHSGRCGRAFPGSASHDAGGAAGLSFLRRDGFASLDAAGVGGVLTTRPLRFGGSRLFVNLQAPTGELRVEVLDEDSQPIAPFNAAACHPATADSTRLPIVWQGGGDLAALAGRPVRFRFHLRSGSLYAFWVSADDRGTSNGFVAAGGPGFAGERDR
jgi:hypothetical protein